MYFLRNTFQGIWKKSIYDRELERLHCTVNCNGRKLEWGFWGHFSGSSRDELLVKKSRVATKKHVSPFLFSWKSFQDVVQEEASRNYTSCCHL